MAKDISYLCSFCYFILSIFKEDTLKLNWKLDSLWSFWFPAVNGCTTTWMHHGGPQYAVVDAVSPLNHFDLNWSNPNDIHWAWLYVIISESNWQTLVNIWLCMEGVKIDVTVCFKLVSHVNNSFETIWDGLKRSPTC